MSMNFTLGCITPLILVRQGSNNIIILYNIQSLLESD